VAVAFSFSLLIALFAFSAWQVADDGEVDHVAMIESWNKNTFQEGKAIYEESCAQCDGLKGSEPPNPTAAFFTDDALKNGNDPYSIYQTLTEGFNQMLPETWLSPQERYHVIYYIGEAFFQPSNLSQYTEITQSMEKSMWWGVTASRVSTPRMVMVRRIPTRAFTRTTT
jgi:cytochrome c5